MSATLLAELEAFGLAISREGDTLRVRGTSGVNPGPYRAHITANKPALLEALLHREEEASAALTDELERGWRWMETHPAHAELDAFVARWLVRLRRYEEACRAVEVHDTVIERQFESRLPTEAAPHSAGIGMSPQATPDERSGQAVAHLELATVEELVQNEPAFANSMRRLDETPNVLTPDDPAPVGCPTPERCPKLGGCAVYRRTGRCGYDRSEATQ